MTTEPADPRSLNEAEHFPFDGTDAELIAACRERPWRYAQRVADRLEARLRSDPPVDEQGGGASSDDDRAVVNGAAEASPPCRASVPCAETSPDYIANRLLKGQKFNAYELTKGGWVIALGPITDFLQIAATEYTYAADYLVGVLRDRYGQQPVTASAIEAGTGETRSGSISEADESATRRGRPDDPTTVRARALEEADMPMSREEIVRWIGACNHSPARQVLREYLSMKALAGKEPS